MKIFLSILVVIFIISSISAIFKYHKKLNNLEEIKNDKYYDLVSQIQDLKECSFTEAEKSADTIVKIIGHIGIALYIVIYIGVSYGAINYIMLL